MGSNRPRINLDHNSTTPPSIWVRESVSQWLETWGNPSSVHFLGRDPKAILREARRSLALMLDCDPLEIVFTGSGSESNNLAVKGIFESSVESKDPRRHVLVGSVEHPSVLKSILSLRSRGLVIETIPVDRLGRVDLGAFEKMLRPGETLLVSMMLANNETGSIFPIGDMARLAKGAGAYFHTDAVQAFGKIPVHVSQLGVDLLSLSGHKFYTLRGVGALYVRRGTPLESLIHGGGHERGRRAGTENTLAIASLGCMADKQNLLIEKSTQMKALRDVMEARILAEISNVSLTGAGVARIPNTSSFVLEGVDGEVLLMNLDMAGISVSTGAACSSGLQEPSSTLRAMGLSPQEAQSSLRVSLGWDTTPADIDAFIETLTECVNRGRKFTERNKHGDL